jgi:hypothetical protein
MRLPAARPTYIVHNAGVHRCRRSTGIGTAHWMESEADCSIAACADPVVTLCQRYSRVLSEEELKIELKIYYGQQESAARSCTEFAVSCTL